MKKREKLGQGLKFYETNIEKLEEKIAKINTGGGIYWNVDKKGKSCYIRVLPPWKEDGIWFFNVSYHWLDIKSSDRREKVICVDKSEVKSDYKCPICSQLARHGLEDLKGKSTPVAQSLYTMNVVSVESTKSVSDASNGNSGLIFEAKPTVIYALADYFNTDDWGDFTNPNTGFYIKLEYHEENPPATKYKTMMGRQSSSIPPEWLDGIRDLDKHYQDQVKSRDEIKKITIDIDWGKYLPQD